MDWLKFAVASFLGPGSALFLSGSAQVSELLICVGMLRYATHFVQFDGMDDALRKSFHAVVSCGPVGCLAFP